MATLPSFVASQNGHLDVVRYLVEEVKQDAGKANNSSVTRVHGAAQNGHLDVVRYLVEEDKVDFNKASHNRWAPLHIATSHNHTAVADYLRSIGAK